MVRARQAVGVAGSRTRGTATSGVHRREARRGLASGRHPQRSARPLQEKASSGTRVVARRPIRAPRSAVERQTVRATEAVEREAVRRTKAVGIETAGTAETVDAERPCREKTLEPETSGRAKTVEPETSRRAKTVGDTSLERRETLAWQTRRPSKTVGGEAVRAAQTVARPPRLPQTPRRRSGQEQIKGRRAMRWRIRRGRAASSRAPSRRARLCPGYRVASRRPGSDPQT